MDDRPVICLFGPTGVGKTDLLLNFFQGWAEIVSVDSIQAYRGLDIGSAKPTPNELEVLPHHLIDILDPSEPYDAGIFLSRADAAVTSIHAAGRVSVLSGGTAFYFKNFLFGLPKTPISEPEIRKQVENLWNSQGEESFRNTLRSVDPDSERRILLHDAYRLKRAYEVWLQTGKPLSEHVHGTQFRPGFRFFLVGLDRPRSELYERIDRRVDALFDRGLLEEVRGLISSGYGEESPAMKGIGYAELLAWLVHGNGTFEEAVDTIKRNSRHYAKRQITFFRSLPNVHWFHPDQTEKIAQSIRDFLQSSPPRLQDMR